MTARVFANYPSASATTPVVLWTCAGMSPSCRSPVVDVPDGSNIRMSPPVDEGLCSVPRGTTNVSGPQIDGPLAPVGVAERDAELAADHEKELVGVVVSVPDVLPPGVRDTDVVVVDLADDPRAVDLVELGERGLDIHGRGFHTATIHRRAWLRQVGPVPVAPPLQAASLSSRDGCRTPGVGAGLPRN